MRLSTLGPLAVLALLAGPGCRPASQTGTAAAEAERANIPAPTDPRRMERGEENEEEQAEQRLERQAWLDLMHRSDPEVDWREVEEANRRAERLRRNELRRSGGLGAAGEPGSNNPLGAALPWEEIGSRNQAGHTRCCAIGGDQGGWRYLYLGSAGGGLWRSPLGSEDWEPLSDSVFGGVDDVVALVSPAAGDLDVLVMRRGTNVLRSDDGGLTWLTPPGLGGLAEIRRIVTLPDAEQTVLILARGNTSGGTKLGLWASTDLGASFQERFSFAVNWSGDVWAPQLGAGNDVYVLVNGRLRKSTDKGQTFNLLHAVATSGSEGALVGSEAGGPHLYPLLRQNGAWRLYASTDGGQTSVDRGELSGYWGGNHSIMAFPDDPLALVYGGVDGRRSVDGGVSFDIINSWTAYYGNPAERLHADLRGMNSFPDPDQPGQHLGFIHTDGGTYLTTDHGQTVANQCLEGLGVGQFYDTLTSSLDPRLVVGGTQDQGYQRGYVQPPSGPGPSTDFDQLISGDYGHFSSTNGDHKNVYSTYPGFVLIQRNTSGTSLDLVDFPAGADNLWLPPVVADPLVEDTFYFLGDRLWRYERSGADWNPTLHSTQNFAAGAGSFLSAMAFAPSDATKVYAATDAGRLWHSSDGGVTWTESIQGGPSSHFFYGSSLVIDPADSDHAFVGGAGYSGVGVRETTDGGGTWSAAAAGLPNTLAFELAWAVDGSDDIYAATEAGAWVRRAATGQWENAMGLSAPNTTYWSVEGVEATGRMRFGTYGRGIWDLATVTEGDDLGLAICSPAHVNSTNLPAVLYAGGSTIAASNDLTLTAEQMPPNQFGYFLASQQAGLIQNPGASQGDLCLTGDLVRYAANILNSGAVGSFQMDVDLTGIPSTPPTAVVAGETWYFQAWFRDFNFIATSNFTDAVSVTFH